ncbi:hypothetical protein JW960_05105 [candidate division KSB1 bacterium]|nr:hypothetical protein [candidate division KSB1 bacterium]
MKAIKYLAVICIMVINHTFASTAVNLVSTRVIDDRVEMLVPSNFQIMSEDVLKLKYPSEQRPTKVYTNEAGSVNLAFRLTDSAIPHGDISKGLPVLNTMFSHLYPSAHWLDSQVLSINNRQFGKFELITPAVDTQFYNLMFVCELDGRMLLFTFNCPKNQMKDWRPSAYKIMKSVRISNS